MNIDDFLNGANALNHEADTLPQVFGLDDEKTISKVKRLCEGAIELDKDSEVAQAILAEADSIEEAVVLTHLMNKLFMEHIMNQSKEFASSVAYALSGAVMYVDEKHGEDVARDVQEVMSTMLEDLLGDE